MKHQPFYQNAVDQIQIFHRIIKVDFQYFFNLFQTILQGIPMHIHHLCRLSDIESAHIVIHQSVNQERTVCIVIHLQVFQLFITVIKNFLLITTVEHIFVDSHRACTQNLLVRRIRQHVFLRDQILRLLITYSEIRRLRISRSQNTGTVDYPRKRRPTIKLSKNLLNLVFCLLIFFCLKSNTNLFRNRIYIGFFFM